MSASSPDDPVAPAPDDNSPDGAAVDDEQRELGLSVVARLVAECLERVDRDGPEAIEDLCRENPSGADELRDRLSALRDLGLLTQGRVGPYRLLRTLGHGGMGLVYLARDERLDRFVALKALPSRLSLNARALKRFRREIKAAAQLHDPRIVPIYDVGETDGVPYFTMEYVEGRTLAETVTSLNERGLRPGDLKIEHLAQAADPTIPPTFEPAASTNGEGNGTDAARLGSAAPPGAGPPLVSGSTDDVSIPAHWGASYVETICHMVFDVAGALEHAHEQGVIHRDVKPSNVLVRGDGRALLFDFGLAMVETDESMTLTGDFTGTPFYVSPEQISARQMSLDRRTDVYSLGVSLYELLTLQRPFTGRNTQDVFRNILGREPTLPRKINPMIPRDLETICLTAIEKDPDKRYQSAAEFAADLRRFLSFEPVRARPVSAVTRLARLARRNRAAAIAVALGLVLAVGTPVGLWQANAAIRAERDEADRQRGVAEQEAERAGAASSIAEEQRGVAAVKAREAEEQRRAAEVEADKVRVINRLLLEMLASPGPQFDGRQVTVVQVLARFADRIGAELSLAPELEVAARATIGNTSIGLGLYDEAREQLLAARDVAAAELARAEGRVTQDALAGVMLALGVTAMRTGRLDDAEQEYGRALEIWRAEALGADARVAGALNNLAFINASRGDIAGAEQMLEQALAIRREIFSNDHREVAETLANLGMMTSDRGDAERAESHYRESLAIQRRVLPAGDGLTATTMRNLALLIGNQGRWEEAMQIYRDALEIAVSRKGRVNRGVADIHAGMALLLRDQGDWVGAEEHLQRAIPIYDRVDPDGSAKFSAALHRLGEAELELGRPEEAVQTLADALAMARRVSADTSRPVRETLETLVAAQRGLGQYRDAEQLLLEFEAGYASLGAPAAESWNATLTMLRELAEEAGWDARADTYQQMLDIGLEAAGN